MNERIKTIKNAAARVVGNPLIPHDARAAIADMVQLMAELIERVEKLESNQNGKS